MTTTVRFKVDYSTDLSKCYKCKQAIPKYGIRFTKVLLYNPSICYYHINCLFKEFQLANITTDLLETTEDIENFDKISESEKKYIADLIKNLNIQRKNKSLETPEHLLLKGVGTVIVEKQNLNATISELIEKSYDSKSFAAANIAAATAAVAAQNNYDSDSESDYGYHYRQIRNDDYNGDNKFETFIRICNKISSQNSDLAKTNVLREFIIKGSNGRQYHGDLKLFVHMLLPTYKYHSFDINTTSLIQMFSYIFQADLDNMMYTLFRKKGDVAKTIKSYFRISSHLQPLQKSRLTLKDVDQYLNELASITNDDKRLEFFYKVASNCTVDDLEMIIRIIKKDLRINMMVKAILDSIALNGYAAFAITGNLDDIIQRSQKIIKSEGKPGIIRMKHGTSMVRHSNEIFKLVHRSN